METALLRISLSLYICIYIYIYIYIYRVRSGGGQQCSSGVTFEVASERTWGEVFEKSLHSLTYFLYMVTINGTFHILCRPD